MISINIHEAKTQLSKYLAKLRPGERILICKRNVPIAELRALPQDSSIPRPIGLAKGKLSVPKSFFEALPDDVLEDFESGLYTQIKELAACENRSISQQILYLVKRYIANKRQFQKTKMPAEVLLDLSGSWDDSRSADEIVSDIKNARKNSSRFQEGSDVFT